MVIKILTRLERGEMDDLSMNFNKEIQNIKRNCQMQRAPNTGVDDADRESL